MKIEEAMEILTQAENNIMFLGDDLKIAIKVAYNALEKQIPKKPTIARYTKTQCVNHHNIPVINKTNKMPFCPFCGQAIDWNEES